MASKLYIRSFASSTYNHVHDYHQLVIALSGSADNFTEFGDGRIGPGQCIVFPAGVEHRFTPDAQSRYLVADLDQLPQSLTSLPHPVVSVPLPVLTFCHFVEAQLQSQLSPDLERHMIELFVHLLDEQDFLPTVDTRIGRAIEYLQEDLTRALSLKALADKTCLSLSQCKALFKKETGKTAGQYQTMLRMEKAQAMLAHTDCPVGLIANTIGYSDVSAFSRRFSQYFGHSPRQSRKQ